MVISGIKLNLFGILNDARGVIKNENKSHEYEKINKYME